MIIYDTKNWTTTLNKIYTSFGKAHTTRMLLIYNAYLVVYALFIVLFDIYILPQTTFKIDPLFFSFLGFILSFVLVFRLNSSYDKWWEGRKSWGNLVNLSRQLATHLHALIPIDDLKTRQAFATQIANFSMALQAHLRDERITQEDLEIFEHPTYFSELTFSPHIPEFVAKNLSQNLEIQFSIGNFPPQDRTVLKPVLGQMLDVLGVCERIKNTPIPFSHSSFIKMFVLTYLFVLPFGLVASAGYFVLPMMFLVGYALLGIEIICEEVEDPFGREANDLPLIHLSNIIKNSVFHILEVTPKKHISSTGINTKFLQIVH